MNGDKIIPVSNHRKDKIKIAESTDGPPYWKTLMPIVEFCLERGGKFAVKNTNPETPFHDQRNGAYLCLMVGPTTVQDVLDHFELPDNYAVGEPYINAISCRKFRSIITFRSFEEQEASEKRSAKRAAEFEKRQEERTRKRQEQQKLTSDNQGVN